MYIVTKERALAQARALSGALALAERAGWTFDRKTSLMLRPPFSNYLHVAASELLLVPSIEPSRGDLDIVDRGMGAYTDVLYVDKRTHEDFRRIRSKDPEVASLLGAVEKARHYQDVVGDGGG